MSERVYVVRCDRDSSEVVYRGWFAHRRARNHKRWLDKHYACGPHRIYEREVAREHPKMVPVDMDYPGYVEVIVASKEAP